MLFSLLSFFFFFDFDNVKQTFRLSKARFDKFDIFQNRGSTHDSTCEGRVLNTSRTSIPSVLRNVGRKVAISLWAEIVRSKQIAIPEGRIYRNIFARRFPREAWPVLEGTGSSELRRVTCIRNHFPKKGKKRNRSCYYITTLTFHFREIEPTLIWPFFDIIRIFFTTIIVFLLLGKNNFISRFHFLGLNRASSISSVCGFW